MLGPEDLCLCCGTVRQADFRQLVEAAAANGYRAISLWPHLSSLSIIAETVRNRGKWESEDQLGTLNYITAEKIVRASADDARRNLGPGGFESRLWADGIYAFLLVAQPLCVTGAVGSPVNPVAIK